MPDLKELFFIDLDRELNVTQAVLAAIPEAHFDFKPHEKSMSLLSLAIHTAHIPQWAADALATDTLDFTTVEHPPKTLPDTPALLAFFDKNAAALRTAAANINPDTLTAPWTMRNGPTILTTKPRHFVYRVWCLNHLINHRAQLALYLRLLNLPVPTLYFMTSDSPNWSFD